jgi:hypothetical protein
VSESTRVLIMIILVTILVIVLAFFVQSLMMKRAMKAVIKALRTHQALTLETAKFAADMGIQKRGIINLKALRDYKPNVVQYFIGIEVIQVTEDGKIYLSEEKLLQSGIEAALGMKKVR